MEWKQNLAAVVDFDGTISTVDVGDAFLQTFVEKELKEKHYQALTAGAMSLKQFQERLWQTLKLGRVEFELFSEAQAQPRDGLIAFFRHLKEHGHPVAIASSGFDAYVLHLLGRFGVEPTDGTYCNHITFSPTGISVSWPWFDKGCGRCSVCKRLAIDDLREKFPDRKVVLIGDGLSDFCAAEKADFVFACGNLADYCKKNNIAHKSFESFSELTPYFAERIS